MPGFHLCIRLITLFSCIAVPLMAADLRSAYAKDDTYSLADLYKTALEGGESVQISQKDLETAQNLKKKALSVLKPSVTAFGSYTRYSEKKYYQNALLQPEWQTAWGLRLDQSFTVNGKELVALRITEDGIKKAQWDLHSAKEAHLLALAVTYYDVLKAQKRVEVARADMDRLSKHHESVCIRLKIEDVTRTTLYRAEAQLSQSKAELIRASNWLRLKRTALANLADLPKDYKIAIPEAGLQEEEVDFNALKKRALSRRPELLSLTLQKEITEKRIKLTRSDYWPKIAVEGVYSKSDQGPANYTGYDDSMWLGVKLEFRLFDGGLRRAQIRDERIQKKKVALSIRALTERIVEEVEQAYLDYITQKNILKSLRDQHRSSRENYDAVTRQFTYGLATSLDVIDANTLLTSSEGALSEAEYSYRLALIKIDYATGDLLNCTATTP